MRVQVRLYGTLKQRFPGYRHVEGVQIEIPEGATVGDLLDTLKLSGPREVLAVVAGRVAKLEEKLQGGAPVSVFQAMGGG